MGSAEDRLDNGQVSTVEAVRWVRNLLDGLHHAHSRGVIHRDVKPANLLLRPNGTSALSDFGLAEETVRRLMRLQYVPHCAPELMAGAPSSAHTDIWASGCTLYRLLTGRYPFSSVAESQAGLFEPAHHLNPQIPIRLHRVIERALSVNPADRFASAPAMIAPLAICGVRYSWERIPGRTNAWRWTDGPHGVIEVEIRPAKRGGFEVYGTRDLGSGPRRFCNPVFNTEGQARHHLRRLLLRGVAGDKPA
jgi:serine/threonine-protein kinase